MGVLDYLIGVAGLLLALVSVVRLVGANVRPSVARARRAAALALGVAVTVYQPFGVVGVPRSQPPVGALPVGSTSVHAVRPSGSVPVLPFVVYRRDYPVQDESDSPQASLRVRSWFWLPPLMTDAVQLSTLCSVYGSPCWSPSERGRVDQLSLADKNGRYYLTLQNPTGPAYGEPPAFTWELEVGIAFLRAFIYWALVALLVPAAFWRARHVSGRQRLVGQPKSGP